MRTPLLSLLSRRVRRFPGIHLLGAAAIAAAWLVSPTAQDAPAAHVIVISIDGFRPAAYLNPAAEHVSMPNLQALADAGSFAEGVEVSYPSMTYPSHTSLATGVRPVRHGIISNTMFDPPSGSPRWYYENSAMRVPAIWDAAREHGLTTAGVSWPVTVGATMDVLYPESNQAPPDGTWLARARSDSTPGLVDAVVADLGGFGENANRDPVQRDRFAAAVATRIIRTARPNLLMVHLMETDAAQHADGPGSPAAAAALGRIDAHIGAIVRATEEAGIRARTAFLVSGDHGFSRVHTLVQPNVVLREHGWLETDARGRVTRWDVASHATAIRLRDPQDHALAARAEAAFLGTSPRHATRASSASSGVTNWTRSARTPEAAFFVEPAEGYYVSDGVANDAVLVGTTRRGAHGFLPTEARMRTGWWPRARASGAAHSAAGEADRSRLDGRAPAGLYDGRHGWRRHGWAAAVVRQSPPARVARPMPLPVARQLPCVKGGAPTLQVKIVGRDDEAARARRVILDGLAQRTEGRRRIMAKKSTLAQRPSRPRRRPQSRTQLGTPDTAAKPTARRRAAKAAPVRAPRAPKAAADATAAVAGAAPAKRPRRQNLPTQAAEQSLTPAPVPPPDSVTDEEIRMRADFLSLERGPHGGNEIDFWLQAERELRGRRKG
ncbi:MAG: alkaline phosphatase family protein [Vicinamibacterales bacterium]